MGFSGFDRIPRRLLYNINKYPEVEYARISKTCSTSWEKFRHIHSSYYYCSTYYYHCASENSRWVGRPNQGLLLRCFCIRDGVVALLVLAAVWLFWRFRGGGAYWCLRKWCSGRQRWSSVVVVGAGRQCNSRCWSGRLHGLDICLI